MHHVARQNASDVKLSATGKELVAVIPVSAKPNGVGFPRAHPCTPCIRRGDQNKCQWHVIEPVYVWCGLLSRLKEN